MNSIIKELKRRHVFRTVGLYIGAAWILLQAANMLLPIYDAPEWILKALIGLSIVGLPITVILAWVFDLTDRGIQLDSEVSEIPNSKAISHGRKVDFVIIGMLLVGLSGSLFLNFKPKDPLAFVELKPLSVLIADFSNQTGDTVFDGALEQVLSIGLEESSFVTAYDRTSASRILETIDETATLDSNGARLVSTREGISVVVSGEVKADGGKYEVSVFEINPTNGDVLAQFNKRAGSKSDVLMIVGELARKLRKKLGDVSADKASDSQESFTTVSLEAMHDYVMAQRLARDGKVDEALDLYKSAIEHDPHFGRAYTGLAVSADKLGQIDVAEQAWAKALENLDGMTERERYGTMGIYYSIVSRNSAKAIENYEALIKKYPADSAGHNNLAVAYFMELQFDRALEAGRKVVGIYPNRAGYRANYALYAMYVSDFETAKREALKTLELNPNYHHAYLPFAISALTEGDYNAAKIAYEKMAGTGTRGESLANIGLADMLISKGDAAEADLVLLKGIETDRLSGNKRGVATKKMMRAYAHNVQGKDQAEITALIEESLDETTSMSLLVPAALMYLDMDNVVDAQEIATILNYKLDVQSRAYAQLIGALITLKQGDNVKAIDELLATVELADVWLARYNLGIGYATAGFITEANFEFQTCAKRIGEAYSIFLDDTPTYRYAADLSSWIEKTSNPSPSMRPELAGDK